MRVLEKLTTPVVVLGVLVLVVAVNALLFYRYQQRMEASPTDTATLPSMEGKGTAVQTPPSEEKEVPVVVEVVDAPAGLSIYEDGQLVVDKSKKFQHERGDWSNVESFITV